MAPPRRPQRQDRRSGAPERLGFGAALIAASLGVLAGSLVGGPDGSQETPPPRLAVPTARATADAGPAVQGAVQGQARPGVRTESSGQRPTRSLPDDAVVVRRRALWKLDDPAPDGRRRRIGGHVPEQRAVTVDEDLLDTTMPGDHLGVSLFRPGALPGEPPRERSVYIEKMAYNANGDRFLQGSLRVEGGSARLEQWPVTITLGPDSAMASITAPEGRYILEDGSDGRAVLILDDLEDALLDPDIDDGLIPPWRLH